MKDFLNVFSNVIFV